MLWPCECSNNKAVVKKVANSRLLTPHDALIDVDDDASTVRLVGAPSGAVKEQRKKKNEENEMQGILA